MRTTTIGFLALVVLSGGCEPGAAERCCEAMAGMFPHRPSVNDILEGYAGRRVYNENDLIQALGDESVRSIIVAGDFETTQTITFWRDGVSVVGAGGATIRSGANPVFLLDANDLSFRNLVVKGIGENQEAVLVFETITDGQNPLNNLVIDTCHFRAARVFEGIPGGVPHAIQNSRIVNNFFDWDTEAQPGAEMLRLSAYWSVMSGNVWMNRPSKFPAALYVSGFMAIQGNSFGLGDASVFGGSTFIGNTFVRSLTGTAASIIGNVMVSGGIDTSAGSGNSAIIGNSGIGNLTTAPGDLSSIGAGGGALNKL